MALKGCYGFLKWMVFIFNLIFWLVGIGVLAASLWLIFDSTFYLQVVKNANSYITGTYILLSAGAFMTIIGFLGCCGTLRESQCLLGTFFVFLMIILVAEIAGGVWAHMNRAELNKMIHQHVQDFVRKSYGVDKATTVTFDIIQKELQCCGSDDYNSWSSSVYNGAESTTTEIGIGAKSMNFKVPPACCKDPEQKEKCEEARQIGIASFTSTTDFIHTEGCITKLAQFLEAFGPYVFGIVIAVGILEILGMIFSMLLCCAIRKIEDFKA